MLNKELEITTLEPIEDRITALAAKDIFAQCMRPMEILSQLVEPTIDVDVVLAWYWETILVKHSIGYCINRQLGLHDTSTDVVESGLFQLWSTYSINISLINYRYIGINTPSIPVTVKQTSQCIEALVWYFILTCYLPVIIAQHLTVLRVFSSKTKLLQSVARYAHPP